RVCSRHGDDRHVVRAHKDQRRNPNGRHKRKERHGHLTIVNKVYEMITIALADDHNLIREGLASLLEEEPNFKIVAQCSNGRELLTAVEELRPQVAVVDISMPELNGIDAARQIRKISPSTRIIALSVYTDESYVRDMVEAGVSGYVVKAGAAKDLVDAIRKGS